MERVAQGFVATQERCGLPHISAHPSCPGLPLYAIIHLWLRWGSAAARQLSLVAGRGLLSRCGAWAPHCGGFSVAQALAHTRSAVVMRGLRCSAACGASLDRGSNPRRCTGRGTLSPRAARQPSALGPHGLASPLSPRLLRAPCTRLF